jgi:hypothetical protein
LNRGEYLLKKIAMALVLIGVASFSGSFQVGGKSSSAPPGEDATVVLVGAGDIADCKDLSGAEATATLLESIPGTVMAVGDLAYTDGSK